VSPSDARAGFEAEPAFHCTLEIDGITDDSRDSRHRDEIVVSSFSWSESQIAPSQSGLGTGVGRVHIADLHVVARAGTASPKLMVACASGRAFANARLSCRVARLPDAEFLVMTLIRVLISGYQIAGVVDSEGLPQDEIMLRFAEIELRVRRPDGEPDAVVTGRWNVRENQGGLDPT
jgi:type VI secretion system secreted protein Hcp